MLVWEKRFIRFKGERFESFANNRNDGKPTICTPVIFNDGIHCGVGIIANNEILRYGLFAPCDYIASWRAGEILRRLKLVGQDTLCGAYYAGNRSLVNSIDEEQDTKLVIEGIGKEQYHQVMSLPIPEEVVQVLVNDLRHQALKPDLYPLTEEVEAGTLPWREEFSAIGVLRPEERRAKITRYNAVVNETNKDLYSLVTTIGIDQMYMGIHDIRNTLVKLFDMKINEKHPPYILVAIATIMSDVTVAQMNSFTSFRMVEKIAKWVSQTSGYPRFSFFKKRKPGTLSPTEASDLLQKLASAYFPLNKNQMRL